MSRIYDFPLSFNLVRKYVLFTFKRYYGDFVVVGKENVPAKGPVIFAPNHTNALMDALAVHSIAPNNTALIFLARSDIFNNKKAAKFLYFAKMLPAFRMRDGMENLGRNKEIFDLCVEILDNNKALGIMPEGNQEIERKLRPLVKGIFRIAFDAQRKYGTQPGIKIVPVGIDYGDIIKSNKHIIINIGKPIEVSEYMHAFSVNPISATNEIRDKLRSELEYLSLDLASDNFYNCFERVTEIADFSVLSELKLKDTVFNRFTAQQEIAKRLVSIEKSNIEKIEKLDIKSEDYLKKLKNLKLKTKILNKKPISLIAAFFECLLLVITLPVFIAGLILNFFPFFLPVFIRKNILKTKDSGFFGSLQYGLGIVTFPVFYLLQTIIFSCYSNVSWLGIIIFVLVQFPLGKCAIKWNSFAKKHIAKLRFKILVQKKSPELFEAQLLREQIIRMIF